MTLNHYAAEKRLAIFEDLQRSLEPREGTFDSAVLREARIKGAPQMGTTRYRPERIVFEFIYPDPQTAAIILEVTVRPAERIVFLPVPTWVVENIWQGEISGTFHFEGDAQRLIQELQGELAAEANKKWFEPQTAKRRE